MSQQPNLHQWVTTGLAFEGYRIVRSLGVVRGIRVRSRSVFGSIMGGLQTLVGGNISIYEELAEKTRSDAYDLMVRHAALIGANAIISFRYDATEIMAGVTEVLAYGTAVVIEPA
ncbi:MAG: YbjQ family protein [Chthonomonas sp.]|nr:YbjQ family protein [Chthonomonas sp.]